MHGVAFCLYCCLISPIFCLLVVFQFSFIENKLAISVWICWFVNERFLIEFQFIFVYFCHCLGCFYTWRSSVFDLMDFDFDWNVWDGKTEFLGSFCFSIKYYSRDVTRLCAISGKILSFVLRNIRALRLALLLCISNQLFI